MDTIIIFKQNTILFKNYIFEEDDTKLKSL